MRKIIFAGNLDCFKNFGFCGSHPLFNILMETNLIKMGAEAEKSKPQIIPVLMAIIKILLFRSKKLTLIDKLKFIRHRGLRSQWYLSSSDEIYFLPSVPYTCGQAKWIIEIEDITTLFFPYIYNGHSAVVEYDKIPQFHLIKYLLEDKNCLGILSHVDSTRLAIDTLFNSAEISGKNFYLPVSLPKTQYHKDIQDGRTCRFLFTNSWHQIPGSFYYRGGIDMLMAYARLKKKYGDIVELTCRIKLPDDLPDYLVNIIKDCDIKISDSFLEQVAFDSLYRESDVYLLPSARIHIISLLDALSKGLCLITTDGWGIEEYVTDKESAIIVKGRYGKTSWEDAVNHVLREDYSSMLKPDPNFIDNLYSFWVQYLAPLGRLFSCVNRFCFRS